MGAHPYWYFVEYQPNVAKALQELRYREFHAGRYNPVIPFLRFPITPHSPSPGPKHRSIKAAVEASGAEGTRSILDIVDIGQQVGVGVAAPLSADALLEYFGTARPSRVAVEQHIHDVFQDLERGHCVYIVTYKDNREPDGLLFAGYSVD